MGRFQNRHLGPFGGLNQNENPHAIPPNDLIEARNVVHRGDDLGTRPGAILEKTGKQYDAVTTGSNAIQGLHEHRENVDAGRLLLAVGHNDSTKRVFYEHDKLLTNAGAATITAGQNNVWTFATHNNNTFAAGGANADHFWYFDGVEATFPPTQIDVVDSNAVTMLPNYVHPWRNYLFLGGFNPAVPLPDNNSSTVRFCNFAADPTVAANWQHGNTIGFSAYGKSHNTGIANFRDNSGDYLMLLFNDHIETVKLDPQSSFNVPFFINDKIANGCVNQRAYISLGLDAGDAVYVSERGIHTLQQSQQHGTKADTFISWKIRPFFKTLNPNRIKYSVGAYDFRNGRVVIAVSTGSNTAHDALLCLDVKREETLTAGNVRWTIWYLGGSKFVNELKMMRDEDNVWRLYFGTTTGEVGYFDDDTFSDFDTSYTSKFRTADDAMGSAATRKNVGDVTVTIQPAGSYTPLMNIYFDYGRTISSSRRVAMPESVGAKWDVDMWDVGVWATESTPRSTKIYGAGSGNTVGFGFQHATANEPFFISTIDYQVRITGEDTGGAASGT